MVSVLMYLLLAIAAILLAVLLFVKIFNVFFGADTTQKDVTALANMMSDMAKDTKHYEQRPFILQLGQAWLLGFSSPGTAGADKIDTVTTVTVSTQNLPSGAGKAIATPTGFAAQGPSNTQPVPITFRRLPECNDKPCLCISTGTSTDKCVIIDPPAGRSILLAADMGSYSPNVQVSTINPGWEVPAGFTATQGAFTQLAISSASQTQKIANQFAFSQQQTGTQGLAVIPLIVEKYDTSQGTVMSIYLDAKYSRGRQYYYQPCGPTSDASCVAKTGDQSYKEMGTKYCALSGLDVSCQPTQMKPCNDGEEIKDTCLCNTKVVTWGVCEGGNYYKVICETTPSCSQYCSVDDPDTPGCSATEASVCQDDPCGIGGCVVDSQQNACRATTSTDDDLERIGTAIEKMAANPHRYYQTQVFVGTASMGLVAFNNDGTSTNPQLTRPPTCANNACLCTSDSAIKDCRIIDLPSDQRFRIGIDSRIVTTPSIIVEKAGGASLTQITLRPATAQTVGQQKYNRECSPASASCTSLTLIDSLKQFNSQQYCSIDGNGDCTLTSLPVCTDNTDITAPCKCGSLNVLTEGRCVNSVPQMSECNAVGFCATSCQANYQEYSPATASCGNDNKCCIFSFGGGGVFSGGGAW